MVGQRYKLCGIHRPTHRVDAKKIGWGELKIIHEACAIILSHDELSEA